MAGVEAVEAEIIWIRQAWARPEGGTANQTEAMTGSAAILAHTFLPLLLFPFDRSATCTFGVTVLQFDPVCGYG